MVTLLVAVVKRAQVKSSESGIPQELVHLQTTVGSEVCLADFDKAAERCYTLPRCA